MIHKILWLNLNKISEMNILQSADKQGNPSFHFVALGSKAMHSNSIGCPKIAPPSAPVLYWLSHLTCISSLKVKKERKTFVITQLEISRSKQHLFTIFRRILIP